MTPHFFASSYLKRRKISASTLFEHQEKERKRLNNKTKKRKILGKAILFALNIESASFKVAGGILLMFIALDMLGGGASERKLRATAGVGAVPMGTPLLAGPGAITTVMTILQSFSDIVVLLAIAASIFATWLVLSLFVFCSFGNVLGPFCFFLTITCSHSHSRSQPLTHSLTLAYTL